MFKSLILKLKNMKTTFKKLVAVTFIGLFFILLSCEAEKEFAKSNKTITKKISFQEFKTKPIYASLSSKTKAKLEHTPTLDNSNQTFARIGEDYDVYTDEIVETICSEKTTYSMLVEKQNVDKNKLYNLMIEEFEGISKESIIEYKNNFDNKLEYINKYDSEFVLQHSFHLDMPKDINYNRDPHWTFIYHGCSQNVHAYGDNSGPYCPHDQWFEIIEWEYLDGGDGSGNSNGELVDDGSPSSVFGTFDENGYFILGNTNTTAGYSTTGFAVSAQAQHLLNVIKAQGIVMTAAQQNSLSHNMTNMKIIINHFDNPVFISWMLANMMKNHFILNEQVPYFEIYTFLYPLSPEQNAYLNMHPTVNNQVWQFLTQTINHDEAGVVAQNENDTTEFINSNMPSVTIQSFIIEKRIDDSQLDPCSKGVFQQIKNTTQCDFANVLAKLGANTSLYNTTIKTEHNYKPNGDIIDAPGNTVHNSQYNYTIYINPDYDGKTKLFIAALHLHELAHTYFFSLLDDYNVGATNSFYELPILYNAFQNHISNLNANLTHEEIANSYVNAISAALKEYQPGLPQQVYDDMAWGGLIGTPIFNNIFPNSNYRCRQDPAT